MGPRAIDAGVAVKGQSGDSQTTDNMAVVNSGTAATTAATTTTTSSTVKSAPPVTNGHRQPEENTCSESDDDNQTNENAGEDDVPEPITKPLADEEAEKLSNAFQKCQLSKGADGEKEGNSKKEQKSAEIAGISDTLRRMRLAEASESEDPTPQLKDCIEIHHDQILSEEELRRREEEEGNLQEQEEDKGILTRGPSGGRAVNHTNDNQYNHIASKSFPAMTVGMGQHFPQYGNYQQCSYTGYGMTQIDQGYSRAMGPQAFGGKSKRGLDETEAENQPFKYTHPTDTNNLSQPSLMEDAKILNFNGLSGGRVSVRSEDLNMSSLDSNLDFSPEVMRQFSNTDCTDLLELLGNDNTSPIPDVPFQQYHSGNQVYCSTQQPASTMMGGGMYKEFLTENEGLDTGYGSDSQGSPPTALSPPPLQHVLPPHHSMAMSPHSPFMSSSPHSMAASPATSFMSNSPHSMAASPATSYCSMGSPGMATPPHLQLSTSPALVQSPSLTPKPGGFHTLSSPAVHSIPTTVTSQGFSAPPNQGSSVIENLLREPNPTSFSSQPTPRVKVAPRPVQEREPVEHPHTYVDENLESLIDVLETISDDLQANHSSNAPPPSWPIPPASLPRPVQQASPVPTIPQPTQPMSKGTQGHANGLRQQMAPPNKVAIQPLPKMQPSTQSVVVLPPSNSQAVSMGGRFAPMPTTTTSTPILVFPGPSLPSSTIVVVNAPPPQQERRLRTILPKMPDMPPGKPSSAATGKMGPPTDSKTPGNRAVAARNGSATPVENSTQGGTAASRGQGAGTGAAAAAAAAATSEQSQKQLHMLNVARRLVASMTKEDLQYKDVDGDTYLHVAVCKADLNMVQALLERLVREGLKDMIDAQNNMRQTSLYLAVSANQAGMVHLFIRYGADVNVFAERVHSDTGEREIKGALHVAASNGEAWLPSLQALLTSNIIYLNQNNSDGLTALHSAILQHGKHRPDGTRVNSIPIIRTLVQAGADLNAQDKKSGKTPMMYALETRDVAMIETLAGLVDAKRMPILMRTQAFDGSTAFRIAESVRSDFAPQDWQKLWMLLKQ